MANSSRTTIRPSALQRAAAYLRTGALPPGARQYLAITAIGLCGAAYAGSWCIAAAMITAL